LGSWFFYKTPALLHTQYVTHQAKLYTAL